MRPALPLATAAAILGGCLTAATAHAQSSGLSGYSGGYGLTSGALSQPVNVSRRADGQGNTVIVDGVTRIGDDQSVFYRRRTGGAGDQFGGVGGLGAATAVGNNLVVSVQGSNNTVVVNSTQINNGAVTAKTVLNGKVDLDAADGGE